ncbi:MAG: GNAT family N-acetyltransferase [Phycisphaerales bacterium]|nr:MAG: GNAT family N-acetyltransferase [Phycisphaerales bacterium]
MQIVPLTNELVPSAQRLVDRVFPYQSLSERLSLWAYAHRRSLLIRLGLPLFRVKDLTAFWGAVDEGADEVIATTGLYSYLRDAEEAVWLGWFCVAPERRGEGIGSMMLDFSIERAREAGKRYFRLYTSDDPDGAAAQRLYEKKGFAIVKVKKKRPFNVIYRQKILW